MRKSKKKSKDKITTTRPPPTTMRLPVNSQWKDVCKQLQSMMAVISCYGYRRSGPIYLASAKPTARLCAGRGIKRSCLELNYHMKYLSNSLVLMQNIPQT